MREALRLGDLLAVLDSAESTETLLERLIEAAVRTLGTQEGSITQLDPSGNELFFRAAYSASSRELKRIRIPVTTGVIGFVARSGQPLCVQDVSQDARFNRQVDEAVGFTTRSVMAAPILKNGTVFGVIELVNLVGDEDVSQEDLSVLGRFAAVASIILTQERERKGALAFVEGALRSGRLPADGESFALIRETLRKLSSYRNDPGYRRSLRLAALVRSIGRRGKEETQLVEDVLEACLRYLDQRDRQAGR